MNAFQILDRFKTRITKQQYKTIKGQIKAGDDEGALKGLKRLLEEKRNGKNELKPASTRNN